MTSLKLEELLVASHNQGKVREIRDLLSPVIPKITSAADYNLAEPIEDGDTFEANAILKAEAATKATGKPALSDDSGLCINALGGAPGIYSARWAGEHKDFSLAMGRVAEELAGYEDYSAYFVCVLALAHPGQETQTFRGEVHGTIEFPAKGERGFGYDPIFVPNGHTLTFAETDADAKHAISHRAKAFEKFVGCLQKNNTGQA